MVVAKHDEHVAIICERHVGFAAAVEQGERGRAVEFDDSLAISAGIVAGMVDRGGESMALARRAARRYI